MRKILALFLALFLTLPAYADGLIGGGIDGSPWTAYTPAVACNTGTLTSYTVTGRYKAFGKTVFINQNLAITTVGTCGDTVTISLPFSVGAGVIYSLSASDASTNVNPTGTLAAAGSSVSMVFPGSNPAARSYFINGTYEAQ